MADLLSLLLTNPHGIDNSPLKYGQSVGEIRNADDPYYGTGGPSMPASLAYLLSGIPMASEGIHGAREASLAGDPLRVAGNIAQTGLAALPATGSLGAKAVSTMPRLASILAGSYIAPEVANGDISFTTPAEAAGRNKKSVRSSAVGEPATPPPLPVDNGLSPAENVEMIKLQKRISNADWGSGAERRAMESRLQQLQGVSADYARNKNAAATEAAKIKATSAASLEAQKASAAQADAEAEAAANTPFKKAHPIISAAIPAATSLAALLVGSRLGSGNRRVFQEGLDELADKITSTGKNAVKAFNSGDTLTASRLTTEGNELKGQLDALSKKGEAGIGGSILGASAIGDLGMAAPTIIDKATALPGSKLEEDTNKQFELTPENAQTWGGRMLLGALLHGGAMEAGALAGRAYQGPVKSPSGVGAQTTSLSALLKEGGTSEATAAQKALGDYDKARQGRRDASDAAGQRNQQLGNAAAQVEDAALASSPDLKQLPSPEHHSTLQPRNKKGRFSGPPLRPENDK